MAIGRGIVHGCFLRIDDNVGDVVVGTGNNNEAYIMEVGASTSQTRRRRRRRRRSMQFGDNL
jgi:hypothetical protein